MAEYIDRETLLEEIEQQKRASKSNYPRRSFVVGDVLACIRNAPSADVAPLMYGSWETVIGSNGKEYMVCTECRVQQELTCVFTYCPNCGAKMDK